jgi:RNA polymerase sigma-70 factor (ECF subfamily)
MHQTNKSLPFVNEDFSNLLSDGGDLFLKYLFDSYYAEFCRLSFRYVGNTQIAEDLVQDVFINLWNKRYDLNGKGNIKPYLIKSVINISLNYIRSKFAKQNLLKEDITKEVHSHINPHDELISYEIEKLLKTAIENLPDKCRTIFMLSRFTDLSYKEIADQLCISIKTVETQMSIALKKIRQFLSRFGYFPISAMICCAITV